MLLFVLGLLKLGALVRYIPVSIVIGFTNGIAVLIALSQVRDLLGLRIDKLPSDFLSQLHTYAVHAHTVNLHALALGAACVAGLALWPRLFAAGRLPVTLLEHGSMRGLSRVPGPMVAVVTLTAASTLLGLPRSCCSSPR